VRVGFTNGCFDLFHDGHRWFLEQCKAGYLIVAVNSDLSVKSLKGPGRPFDPLTTRMARVRQYLHFLRGDDSCAVVPFEGFELPLILQMQPDVVFKGADHSPNMDFIPLKMPVGRDLTGHLPRIPVIHIPRLPGVSTTIIARSKERGGGQRS
jgi:cytidyltransferase-like protein